MLRLTCITFTEQKHAYTHNIQQHYAERKITTLPLLKTVDDSVVIKKYNKC